MKKKIAFLVAFVLLFSFAPPYGLQTLATEPSGTGETGFIDTTVGDLTSGYSDTYNNILTTTMGVPIGMYGFEGEYAIDSFDETVEIIVQFDVPPAVALRLIQEQSMPRGRSGPVVSYEEQALAAHTAFNQELSQLMFPLSADPIEIFSEYHNLFNGVYMRVPAGAIETIASLPGVFGVFPNLRIVLIDDIEPGEPDATETSLEQPDENNEEEPENEKKEPENEKNESETDENNNGAITPITSEPIFEVSSFKNDDLLKEARVLFGIDDIHKNEGITGAGIRVAVIDTGIDHTHPEFKKYLDDKGLVPGWDFWHNVTPSHPHGTSVSGALIAMAPDIELYNYRINVTGGGGGGDVMDALERAHSDDIDIINLSFGTAGGHPFDPITYAINLAVLDGMIAVAAAGNSGTNGAFTVETPAAGPLLISAGAGTAGGSGSSTDNIASFSSRGPVRQTYHIKPDIIAPGQAIYTTQLHGGYADSNGTSFAAPIISGIAALMLEKFPDADPFEIKARLMNKARPLGVSAVNTPFISGAGFVQPADVLVGDYIDTIVTAEQLVPVSSVPTASYVLQPMASLSFGVMNKAGSPGMNESITLNIENKGASAKTYSIAYQFANNPDSAAALGLSEITVTVAPETSGQVNVTMNIPNTAGVGYYYGYITVSEGIAEVARIPFAAVVTETVTNTVSDEAALRAAVAGAGSIPTVIELMVDIDLTSNPLTISAGSDITLTSSGDRRTLCATGNFVAISNSSGAKLTIDGVNITRASGTSERGVHNIGTFVLVDGVISGHSRQTTPVVADNGGGGVWNQGSFIMEGGEISANTAALGGGVMNSSGGSMTMYGGVIKENNAANGGGVFNFGTLNLQNGSISENTATGFGGGMQNQGTANMSGGEISGNSAPSGGGVNIVSSPAPAPAPLFDMTGGVISGNSATGTATAACGGGIHINAPDLNNGYLKIGANASFSGNSAQTPRDRHSSQSYSNILCTRWTDPFTQGINDYDIISYGDPVTIRTLSFMLGTSELSTVPENIADIKVIAGTPILNAPSFPANPTREGREFGGWYLNSAFLQSQMLIPTSVMPDADTTIHAKWNQPLRYGDVNGDGVIDYSDVTLLLQYLASWNVGHIVNTNNADVNGDGRIEYSDVTLLLQYLAKWDVTLGPKG